MRLQPLAIALFGLLPGFLTVLASPHAGYDPETRTDDSSSDSDSDSDSVQPAHIHTKRDWSNYGIWCNEARNYCQFVNLDAAGEGRVVPSPIHLPAHTRCDPNNPNEVLRYDGYSWVYHVTCGVGGICHNMQAMATCFYHEYAHIPAVSASLEPATLESKRGSRLNTRCKRGGFNYIESFDGSSWNPELNCSLPNSCVDLNGLAACHMGGSFYSIPGAGNPLSRRQTLPIPPDLDSFDTRCNPANFSEVQRFNGVDWILHDACGAEVCKDVNGIGACQLDRHQYRLPAANDTTDLTSPLDGRPVITTKRCNHDNATEVLAYSVIKQAWVLDGVCFSPTVCREFKKQRDTAGIALCAQPDQRENAIWLPWDLAAPVPPLDPESDARTTICKNSRELVSWDRKNKKWVSHSRCAGGWQCRYDRRLMAGCYAPNLHLSPEFRTYYGERQYSFPFDDQHPPRGISDDTSSSSDDEEKGGVRSTISSKVSGAISTMKSWTSEIPDLAAKRTDVSKHITDTFSSYMPDSVPKYESMHSRRIGKKKQSSSKKSH